MLGQFNTTKNRLVDYMSTKERLKQINDRKERKPQVNQNYSNIKEYILRKEKEKF